jgi:hypothetical protein
MAIYFLEIKRKGRCNNARNSCLIDEEMIVCSDARELRTASVRMRSFARSPGSSLGQLAPGGIDFACGKARLRRRAPPHHGGDRRITAAISKLARMPSAVDGRIAIKAPDSATPSAAPVWRAAFSTPAAIPARLPSTQAIRAAVVAGVIKRAASPIAGNGNVSAP